MFNKFIEYSRKINFGNTACIYLPSLTLNSNLQSFNNPLPPYHLRVAWKLYNFCFKRNIQYTRVYTVVKKS